MFGNWMQTASGETETVTFTYSLPFNVFADTQDDSWLEKAKNMLGAPELGNYTILLQKQSVVETRSTTVDVALPESFTPLWATNDALEHLRFTSDNSTDSFAAWLIERE